MLFPDQDFWTVVREIGVGTLFILAFMGLVVWRRLSPQRAAIVHSVRPRVRRIW
jgi:hypothetical protein